MNPFFHQYHQSYLKDQMKYLQTPFITWSRTKQPETTMENTKKTALLKVICQFIISKLTKDLLNIGKNTTEC